MIDSNAVLRKPAISNGLGPFFVTMIDLLSSAGNSPTSIGDC